MFGKKDNIFTQLILHGAILVSFVHASPVSHVQRQVGLSEDAQVLTVNGSQDCEYGGKIYHNGDNFKDPSDQCSTCQCSGGDVSCSVMACPPSPTEECEEVKAEGKCCPSYVCPIKFDVPDDRKRTESALVETTTLTTLNEADDKTEDSSIDQAQNAVNSLFIHKVILETIGKEKEQVESTEATLTEIRTSDQEASEPIQTSTLSENDETDEHVESTTLEAVNEMDISSEPSVEENLIRETSDVSTIRSETSTTLDSTENSAQEEKEKEQSLFPENSSPNEETQPESNASEKSETTETPLSDSNIEDEANVFPTEKGRSDLTEESTPTPIDEFYVDKAEELFTTEPVAEATEASITMNEEAETSVQETENLIKAAESVISSQTEVYLEENSNPQVSNEMETTPYFEERDASTSDYNDVPKSSDQATEREPLESRLSDNTEAFNEVSTISNTEVLDESDGDSSVLFDTETPLDINTVRSVDYISPTELSDEIPVTTSNYEKSEDQNEDNNLLYVFEERIAQAHKSQKSESINIEEINKDEKAVEGTTTHSEIDTRSSSFDGETTTTLDLLDREAVTADMEEAEAENLLRFELPENSVTDFERNNDVTSGHTTTEVYSTTVLSEDTETMATDTENAFGVNSARKESIDETTTSEVAKEENEFILTEESTTQGGAMRILDEAFIPTTEKSEVLEDNSETTKISDVRQESEFLTTTITTMKENEDVESRIKSVIETKSENGETEVKSQEIATEKLEAVEDNLQTTENPVVRQESEILTTALPNKEENEVESRIESAVETKIENTLEKSNETETDNKEKSQEEVTTEKSETEVNNRDTTEISEDHESKISTKTLSSKKENEDVENKVESKLENVSEEGDEPATENEKSQEKNLAESNSKTRRNPPDSNIHVLEKILSNGSVTRIETHSSEDRKRPKIDRVSTQFHHLARKYGLRPLTRKTFKDDIKNRRRYRLSSSRSLFEDEQ